MSRFHRVQQWSTFSKSWHLYDAKWQNPFHSARKLTPVLEGKSKPIYSPNVDCGDHVVIINSRHISLLGREWKFRVYFHHPGYNKVILKFPCYTGTALEISIRGFPIFVSLNKDNFPSLNS